MKGRGNPAWMKGVSGNPHGRPKLGLTMAETIRNHIPAEDLVEHLWRKAKRGSVQAMEVLLEHGWGKAPLQLILTPLTQRYNLDSLSPEELTIFEQLAEKMTNVERIEESRMAQLVDYKDNSGKT